MADKIRHTWRHLALRAKLLLLLLLLCSVAFTGALALDDAYIPWGDSRYLGTNDDIIDSNFPSWFGSAFKTGSGVWDTNIPAWYVAPDDTNVAALEVLFNSTLLTNSLIMRLGYLDASNSSLAIDLLCLTNQAVMTSNLFENILTGSGMDTSRTFNIPLTATNTFGLQFRRGAGSITVMDTLLSPDGDGDGFSDTEELMWGSDPCSALSIPCATITGQVFYAGVQSGVIHVLAATNANDWDSSHYVTMTIPVSSHVAPFTLSSLPLRRTYYARAWRDVNGNQAKDYWEPFGTAVPTPLILGGNTGNVVIAMSDPDSDGDGMSDVDELALGMDPLTWNAYAPLPFLERFETNTVHLGDINGQNGWVASATNAVFVQSGAVWEGKQALAFGKDDTYSDVHQLFAVSNAPVVWVDTHVRAFAAAVPTNASSDSALMFFDYNGYLNVCDGLAAGNKWLVLSNFPPLAMTGEWVRLTVKMDYPAQRWLVCQNGFLAAAGLGFATPVSRFTGVSLRGRRGGMDALAVSTNEPSGTSADGDRLPDDWEQTHFGNTDQVDSGDFDGDGVSNLAEYGYGTNPANADTDGDGMPDGWEITHGFNPTNPADAALDADGDGLSNLAEYTAGTDPLAQDTDHDGLSDGVEVNVWHSNPLAVDSDGDGYTDAGEVAHGSDPADAASRPAANWLNHRKLTFQNNVLTNRLTDIPVLVRLTPERVDYTQCASDGRDIHFTDNTGTPLAFEAERWNPGGESLCWVRIPEVGGTNSPGYFWLYWNNPSATNTANPSAVWSTNYLGVWHLAGTNTALLDSTPGAATATNVGAVSVTGILGDARNFRGSDSIIVPPAALAGISNAVTISFWQYGAPNQPVNGNCLEGTSTGGRELNVHLPWSDGNVYWDAFGNFDRINKLATTNLYKGGWNHWTFTKDRLTGTMRIYVNGELWHSGTGKTRAYTPVTAFRFGSAASGSSGYIGMMDELRLESVARSPEWIRFQNQSMLDQVLIYGGQQVSITGTANGAEPDQAGDFTVMRTRVENTNLALTVSLSVVGGTASEGADYVALPRTVVIPAGAIQTTFPVPVIDDLWLEGTETVTVAIVQGSYFINSTNASASIAIIDNDVDSDSDGLCDAWELDKFGNLDATATGDADSDGVNNLQEYLHGTNPNAADTDGDGLPDQWEIANGTAPLVADAAADPDGDGLTNSQEYQNGINPLASDTDGDGMPDKWEVDHSLNPLVNDAALDPDNEGLSNLKEFQAGTDPHNPDTDGDGLLDGAEVNTWHTNPLSSDTDGDGLSDKWETEHGTNPLVNDAAADPDGDGLSNMGEYFAGTNPLVSDTDGDGVSDGEEVLSVLSDPLSSDFNGTFTTVATINGADASVVAGQWEPWGTTIEGLSGRGVIEYVFTNTVPGVSRLVVEGTQVNTLTTRNKFKIIANFDGEYLGAGVMTAAPETTGSVHFYTPWLTNGPHRVRLEWDNVYEGTILRVNQLLLQSAGGPDVNGNGLPDWLDHRLARTCSLSSTNATSFVSPLCVEGAGLFISGMSVFSSAATNALTPQHLEGGRWYANMPLCATGETVMAVAFEQGASCYTQTVVWNPRNVLDGGSLILRQGDSLKLAATPVGETSGVARITVGSVTSCWAQAGEATIQPFVSAGVFAVTGVFSNENGVIENTLQVRVLGGGFPTNEPICWWGKIRGWDCPTLPQEAVVESNTTVGTSIASWMGGGGRRLNLTVTEGDGTHYVTARIATNGPVLDSRKLTVTWLRATVEGGFYLLNVLADGTQLTEDTLHTGSFPQTGRIRMNIWTAGAVFEDGTLVNWVEPSQLDGVGAYRYRMLVAPGRTKVACHSIAVFDGAESVGSR